MSRTVIEMKMTSSKSIEQVAEELRKAFDGSKNIEYVAKIIRGKAGHKAVLLCFERFYFTNNGYTSLSIMLTENDQEIIADLVSSGGEEHVFTFTRRTNQDMADRAMSILKEHGFQQV